MLSDDSEQDWQSRPELGSSFLISLTIWIALVFGRTVVRFVLLAVVVVFTVTAAEARRDSRIFLERVLSRPVSIWDIYKHFYYFATVSVDRVFVLKNQSNKFDIRVDASDSVVATLKKMQTGLIVAVAHFGSFEILRALTALRGDAKIYILLDVEQNPSFIAAIRALNPQFMSQLIDARMAPSELVLRIRDIIDGGDWVGIMADRCRDNERSVSVDFLNAPAKFPTTAWDMASVLKVPVLACYAAFEGGARYRAKMDFYANDPNLARKDRYQFVDRQVRAYATGLELAVQQSPYNWFNFYDFWQTDKTA